MFALEMQPKKYHSSVGRDPFCPHFMSHKFKPAVVGIKFCTFVMSLVLYETTCDAMAAMLVYRNNKIFFLWEFNFHFHAVGEQIFFFLYTNMAAML